MKHILSLSTSALAYTAHMAKPPQPVPAPVPAPAPVAATADSGNNTPKPPKAAPEVTEVFKLDVIAPTSKRRGGQSVFPFNSLTEIGMAFGVKDRTKASISSVISSANKRARKPKTDGNGAPVYAQLPTKDANGNITGYTQGEQEHEQTAHYVAYDVTPELAEKIKGTKLEGASVIVQRDA